MQGLATLWIISMNITVLGYDNTVADFVIPCFTILEYLFYVGWLKVIRVANPDLARYGLKMLGSGFSVKSGFSLNTRIWSKFFLEGHIRLRIRSYGVGSGFSSRVGSGSGKSLPWPPALVILCVPNLKGLQQFLYGTSFSNNHFVHVICK